MITSSSLHQLRQRAFILVALLLIECAAWSSPTTTVSYTSLVGGASGNTTFHIPDSTFPSSWSPVPNRMLDERWAPAYALLADGRHALIAGGYSYTTGVCVDSADIFDERRRKF